MRSLDDIAAMNKLDPSGVLASTGMFADQCEDAWKASRAVAFPDAYKNVDNVVVCGMGGSRFTPKTIKELYRDRITKPYEIVEDYTLPSYVNEKTLVVLSSFSGTTEEVMSCGKEAIAKGAKLTGVVAGGPIGAMLTEKKLPAYIFDPKFNPCGQPRIGGGYLLMGHLGILSALGLVDVSDKEVAEAVAFARAKAKELGADVETNSNPAKELAVFLKDRHPFIITAEFLKGFGNGFANQINETAKMISDYRYISELNHHLMEGLKRPDTLHQNAVFVFITSSFYSKQIARRFAITREVVEKQNVATHEVPLTGTSKLAQTLEAFTISGYTTFYMAMLYDTDPVAIPWVTYFKEQLAK